MNKRQRGALPADTIRDLIAQGFITGADPKHVSPASLDLTITDELYELGGLMLPRPGESIRSLLPNMEAARVDLAKPLRPGHLYLAKLHEQLALPSHVYGYCNPKSSTGRLDTHVRVLADGISRYDSVTTRGFKGELWVAISVKSFSVQLHPGTPLTQLRLFTGDTRFSELDLEITMPSGLVWHPIEPRPLSYQELVTNDQDGTVVLTALVTDDICGYVCTAAADQVLDVAKIGYYEPADFFTPIVPERGALRLIRDRFYILSAAERVRIPPTLASEMIPMDERNGDFRSHYAGFLDPGWGWGTDGEGQGRPFTLEVRPFEDIVVRELQPIAKISFERMASEPSFHYDSHSSNYLTQFGPKLGKQFKS
jgi:dCTP deaminase